MVSRRYRLHKLNIFHSKYPFFGDELFKKISHNFKIPPSVPTIFMPKKQAYLQVKAQNTPQKKAFRPFYKTYRMLTLATCDF
ncbi:hypothetical protein BZG02_03155 [Labilibaculum filiforme]|uniref:Uncharacterized protein n=1 Tax=Labilibaculum filiforme TaxID=1940526 RepID=A0A2N3I3H9_9BACT|nr:hypothetical protein BZG02_03155 [Labilibaculum filiforme]